MQCTIINNTPSAKLSIKNTFYEVTSEEEASSCEGLRRVNSCPSLCATSSAEPGGDGSSSEHSRSVSMSWATLSDEDELSDWQSSSGLTNEIGFSPVAEEKQHPPTEAARTRLRSAASLFVPSSSIAADTCCTTPSVASRLQVAPPVSRHLEEASAPGVPPAPAPPAQRAGFTTVMMRNLPCGLSRKSLLRIMNRLGFQGLYDFFYLPMDFKRKLSLGYAFVNLTSAENTQLFIEAFSGYSSWPVNSTKVCSITWSGAQGLAANIDRYQNSPVMGDQVPDSYKPVIFDGKNRMPFPKPTKQLRDIVYRS